MREITEISSPGNNNNPEIGKLFLSNEKKSISFSLWLRCAYDDGSNVGITHIRVLGAKVVVVRLAGYIEFFEVGPPPPTTMRAAAATAGASPQSCSTSTPPVAEGSSRRCESVATFLKYEMVTMMVLGISG